MIVCLGCVYIRQISLMLTYLSTFSLGLYFLPDAGKLFLQYQHSTLFYEVKSLPGGKLKPKSLLPPHTCNAINHCYSPPCMLLSQHPPKDHLEAFPEASDSAKAFC